MTQSTIFSQEIEEKRERVQVIYFFILLMFAWPVTRARVEPSYPGSQ